MADAAAIVLAALELGGEIMKQIPDYDQRQIKQYYDLVDEYETERKKPRGRRNDKLVVVLRGQLQRRLEEVTALVGKQRILGVHKEGS